MSRHVPAAVLVLLALGCSKSEHAPALHPDSEHVETDHAPPEPGQGMADLPRLETGKPSDDYNPSPSELPLTEDFVAAAEKRVTPDTYRSELVTIQRELDQLAKKPARKPDADPVPGSATR